MLSLELFVENFLNIDSVLQVYPLLLQGLTYTLLLALVALPVSIAWGLAVALAYGLHIRWLSVVLIAYIDLVRAFPVVVLLVLIFYGLPFLGLNLSGFTAAVLAIALNNSGYYGEIFRAGIEAVPAGQREAGRALGLHNFKITVLIVLPQALRKAMAPFASNSLELVKTTSIAALVALPELLRSARVAQEQTYNPTPLIAAAAIYFVLFWPFARWVATLERRAQLQR